jgi:hypothetical protein
MVVILQKMIMTGAMCVVAQGSSVQLLIATLVMFMYTLLVLKTAPYEEDSEDWTAFVACVALTLTTIGGFALIMDDPTTRTYESAVLAVILIGINVFCIAIEILIVVFVDCGVGERCQRCLGTGRVKKASRLSTSNNNSKVLPVTTTLKKVDVEEARITNSAPMTGNDDKSLKNWGKKTNEKTWT